MGDCLSRWPRHIFQKREGMKPETRPTRQSRARLIWHYSNNASVYSATTVWCLLISHHLFALLCFVFFSAYSWGTRLWSCRVVQVDSQPQSERLQNISETVGLLVKWSCVSDLKRSNLNVQSGLCVPKIFMFIFTFTSWYSVLCVSGVKCLYLYTCIFYIKDYFENISTQFYLFSSRGQTFFDYKKSSSLIENPFFFSCH